MKRSRAYSSARSKRPVKQHAGKRAYVPGVTRTAGSYARNFSRDEKKWLDTTRAHANVPVTAVFMDTLNGLAVGNTVNTRIGNRVCLKNVNLYITASAATGSTAGQGDDVFRVILYIDHQCNGAAATATDILESDVYDSFRNMNQAERFTVLKDKFITFSGLTGAGASTNASNPKFHKMSWKGSMFLHYGGAGATVADLRSNNVGVLLITRSAHISATVQARIKYTDS